MAEEGRVRSARNLWYLARLITPFVIGFLIVAVLLGMGLANQWVTKTINDRHSYYYDPEIAADSTGHIHVCYGFADSRYPDQWIYGVAYLTNAGGHMVERILDNGSGTSSSAVAVDSNNSPHIIYSIRDSGSAVNELDYVRVVSGSFITESVDVGISDRDLAIALDSTDSPHIAYTNETDIIYASRVGGVWSKSALTPIDGFSSLDISDSCQVDITIDSNNVPHVACVYRSAAVVVFDLLQNGSWDYSWWVANDLMGYHIDAAADSHGNVYVAYLGPYWVNHSDITTYYHAVYLGERSEHGSWVFSPYLRIPNSPDMINYGDIGLSIDENDDIHIVFGYTVEGKTTPSNPFGQHLRISCTTEHAGNFHNSTTVDPAGNFFRFGFCESKDGTTYLIETNSENPLLIMTDSASIGQRVSSLGGCTLVFELIAGLSFLIGVVGVVQEWRNRRPPTDGSGNMEHTL